MRQSMMIGSLAITLLVCGGSRAQEPAILADLSPAKQSPGANVKMVCNEQGCHQLPAGTLMTARQRERLIATLVSADKTFADQVAKSYHCEHCDPQETLDAFCLLTVSINPESRVKVDAGKAKPVLRTEHWNYFLIKIQNLAGVTAPLRISSEQMRDPEHPGDRFRWLEAQWIESQHMPMTLSGELLEYRILRVRTDQEGKRAAVCAMDVGQGTADIGFRNDVLLTFNCTRSSTP